MTNALRLLGGAQRSAQVRQPAGRAQHSAAYTAYMQSAAWQRRRLRAMERAGWHCALCGATSLLHVHHRTYDRLGRELDGDLEVLCERCHDRADTVRRRASRTGLHT
jgi:5-methylcytosine-specific restriction endonuclease McrA